MKLWMKDMIAVKIRSIGITKLPWACDVTHAPPSRICIALHSKVRRMRRNFYSFQNPELTAIGIPGWWVLFLVIQVQGPPRRRGEGSEHILACCCFQIGWSNGWLLGTCRGCRLTFELPGPQGSRLEAIGQSPGNDLWPPQQHGNKGQR